MLRIAIDAMSGDLGLRSSLSAAYAASTTDPSLAFTLVGDSDQISSVAPAALLELETTKIVHANSVVLMDEKPSQALRHKRDSSMWMALELLKHGKVDAVTSAGNTGALMAMGMFCLSNLPGIRRPAICGAIPAKHGHTYLLDLGANLECSADDLYRFALMGSALVRCVDRLDSPRIGLLNVGGEAVKGTDSVRYAADLINNDSGLNYVGFVEGDELFDDKVDVIVSDGFVGNVALKSCEGTARFLTASVTEAFGSGPYARLVGMLAMPILRKFHRGVDPHRYNGAVFLGLNGVVVKSHGNANEAAFLRAIETSAMAARYNLTNKLAALMSQ